MKLTCPEDSCQNQKHFQKDGHYFRKSDSKSIQRYRCKLCGKRLSTALLSACYRQKKRTINPMVEALLCSKMSMRRIAKVLRVDKKTVHRKLIFLGLKAKRFNEDYLEQNFSKSITHMQFDDVITKEHTKLKPLSISIAVDTQTRKILGLRVAQIPAFGHLASLARQKYGKRVSTHQKELDTFLEKLTPYIHSKAIIRTDEHKTYPDLVKRHFPNAEHQRFKGGRGCVAGQGELKKLHRDPLFILNHTCAMLRDNIARLIRKSWCLTKSPVMLQYHLDLYMKYHNTELV